MARFHLQFLLGFLVRLFSFDGRKRRDSYEMLCVMYISTLICTSISYLLVHINPKGKIARKIEARIASLGGRP